MSSSVAPPPTLPTNPPRPGQTTSETMATKRGQEQSGSPLLSGSYQHGASAVVGSSSGGQRRAAALPTIRHYDEDSDDPRTFFVVRGDASLRPNVGRTNRYDTALFGLALHELLENIRLTNLASTSASIALLMVTWFWKLLTGQFSRLVLSCYLGFLSGLLLLVEVIGIWSVSSIDVFFKRNFGLLRHPLGRCIYLALLSTMCLAIGGWWYLAVGALYALTATVLLYAWVVYPELRRPFEVEDAEDGSLGLDGAVLASRGSQSVTWSSFSGSFSSYMRAGSETAALLGSTAERKSVSAAAPPPD